MSEIIEPQDFKEKIASADRPVLADFYSESCIPCRRMSPVLEEISEELSDSLSVYKINIAGGADLAAGYGVSAVPTMIFFKDGNEISRIVGAITKNELRGEINRLGL